MYICECGHIFEEPHTYREFQGECHGAPAYETWDVCPACNEPGYEPAEECKECGKLVARCDLEEGLCETCQGEAQRLYDTVMVDTFSEAQRNYLRENVAV